MNKNKDRHTVWLTDEAWAKVKDHYRTDNCSTQNEYIEKAIQFYSGYLDAEQADSYLTEQGIEAMRSKLTNDIFQDELLHLYKQKDPVLSRSARYGAGGNA